MGDETRRALPTAGEVVENRGMAAGHFLLSLRVEETFQGAVPGQFVMIKRPGIQAPLLGRPISLYDLHRAEGAVIIDLLIRVVGRGTALLSEVKPGDRVDILGPLGKGFTMRPDRRQIVFVAGGIGVAPLSFLAGRYSSLPDPGEREITFYAGARTEEALVGVQRLREKNVPVRVSCDDGSCGYRGVVTDLVERDAENYRPLETVVYACGPRPMLEKLQALLKRHRLTGEASVEERMACGIGACLGCAVRMKNGGHQRVCVEGPVFDIQNVELG